ncbi:MFS transporter [Levilactobacillus zymae]|uniref:MFS transporter n=1 Tax=Levilactobacillus zymae TaxID=267363 RepID=A0ABQ0WSJ0_9LACO|nr:MDR family MFS transporter [Levilactobacillus zymae]KRL15701.1 multidrug transport protein [Levilactobacillus zymae DSM 19395]QFR60638.1 DHA2 family efflux MFS transporter permease subunit [Levilactobacillus zymae]GEO70840.1 MFS transporter [Levilactobacillus zymae]
MQTKTVPTEKRFWLVAMVVLGAFVTMLNQTVLAVAQPQLMTALNVNTTTVQWLSTGYTLIGGILIPVTAWLADRYHTKWLYVTCQLIFVIGTGIAATANSFSILLVGRLIQAVGAGVLSGLAMVILYSVYDRTERGVPTALMGMVFGLAPAIGPTLGGYLVDQFGWRSIFYLVLPIALLTLLGSLFFLSDVVAHRTTPLNWPSVGLSTLGFGSLLYGFSTIGTAGWWAVSSTLPIGIGGLLVAWFLYRQTQLPHPVLQVRVFTSWNFSLSAILSAIAQICMVAIEFILPLYLQNLRGLTAIQSGLTLLPGALVMFVLGPVVGQLMAKNKGRQMVLVGTVTMTVATICLSLISLTTPIWLIVFIYALRNIGLSFVMMPAGTIGMNALSQELISHGSSGNNMVRQVGAAMGTSLLISVLQNVATSHAPAAQLLKTNRALYATQMHTAFLTGIQTTLWLTVGISLLGIVTAALLKNDTERVTP